MPSIERRDFLWTALSAATATVCGLGGKTPSAGAIDQSAEFEPRPILPVTAIVTEYRDNSHADVIVGKILEGYDQQGGPGPALRLVSMYTDQVPATDMSRALAEKHGFEIAETIEEAITLGTDKVQVAGVLSIGEHGDYPHTADTNQHMYPRRRFFDAIAATFRKCKQVVPVFTDKHLAYAWEDAQHMVRTARAMKIPLLAGSSIPVAWRRPPLELPIGCEMTEALALGYGGPEAYGFHALEGLQCMVERRKVGEIGVSSVQAVRGKALLEAERQGRWSRALLEAAVESVTGKDATGAKLDGDAVFYLINYRDGLKATVAMNTGLANEFAFAGTIKGAPEPQATWIRLQEGKPFAHFGYLLRAIEHTIRTGTPAYPAERTLLTTGILDAAMHSLARDGKRVSTPQLAVRYRPVDWPFAPGEPPPLGEVTQDGSITRLAGDGQAITSLESIVSKHALW